MGRDKEIAFLLEWTRESMKMCLVERRQLQKLKKKTNLQIDK